MEIMVVHMFLVVVRSYDIKVFRRFSLTLSSGYISHYVIKHGYT
jgi:hypothetical protein